MDDKTCDFVTTCKIYLRLKKRQAWVGPAREVVRPKSKKVSYISYLCITSYVESSETEINDISFLQLNQIYIYFSLLGESNIFSNK